MLCHTSPTPIRGDGAGKFIATAGHYLSGREVTITRAEMAPNGEKTLREFLKGLEHEQKCLRAGKSREPQAVAPLSCTAGVKWNGESTAENYLIAN
jgi:hypothetical protein